MNKEIEEIERDVNANYVYTSPFKEKERLRTCLSHIHALDKRITELETRLEELRKAVDKHKINRFRITDIDYGTETFHSDRLRYEADEELYKAFKL